MFNEFDGLNPLEILKNGLVIALYNQLLDAQADYDKIDNYMGGLHDLRFATEKYTQAFGRLFRAFANNYMPRVVNALSDYLQIEGWESGQEGQQDKLDKIWKSERMNKQSGQVHSAAFRYGDAYVIVAPDSAGTQRIYKQNTRQMRVLYDTEEPDKIVLAVKLWQRLDLEWRLNVYVPGFVYRYSAKTKNGLSRIAIKSFRPLQELGDDEPFEATKSDTVLPVFHFANEAENDGKGITELRDLFPIQDWLNKSLCDMLVGMEYQAFRQRWATGIEIKTDDNGKPIPPMISAIDRLVFSGNEGARFGEFSQITLKEFLDVSEAARTEICRISRIPIHHLMMSGQFASGEALKTAENPLLSKVGDRQIDWGENWEQIAYYYQGVYPSNPAEADINIDAKWKDLSPRSDSEEAQAKAAAANTAVVKIGIGVPVEKALLELGYTQDEIDEFALIEQIPLEDLGNRLIEYFSQPGTIKAITSVTNNPIGMGLVPNGNAPVNGAANGNGNNGSAQVTQAQNNLPSNTPAGQAANPKPNISKPNVPGTNIKQVKRGTVRQGSKVAK